MDLPLLSVDNDFVCLFVFVLNKGMQHLNALLDPHLVEFLVFVCVQCSAAGSVLEEVYGPGIVWKNWQL